MPAHYGASELLIILAAIWAAQRCWRNGHAFAAIGVLLLGLAAAIGTLRILSAPNETLTTTHKTVSGFGGLVGMALVALDFIQVQWPKNQQRKHSLYALVGIFLSLAAAIVNPALTAPLILFWAGCAVIAAFALPSANTKTRAIRAAIVSIVIINFVIVRQNPTLGPDLSWHFYHFIIALWIWVVARILSRV